VTQLQRSSRPQRTRIPVRHEPVFVLAPPRSYSTVTVALLAGHPGIYGFPEMLIFSADTVGELIQRSPRPRQLPSLVESQRTGILRAVADVLEGNQEETAIGRAEEWLTDRTWWSSRHLMDYLLERVYPQVGLEKSPETVASNKAIRACISSYPNARYIHLIRNPVGTMRSTIDHLQPLVGRSEQRGKTLVALAASSWYLSHLRILRNLEQLPACQWVRVRAEDLLSEPATQLPKLLSWLGLPADCAIVRQMMHTENWRFAGTGPSGRLFGGDPKFMLSPVLRAVREPGAIDFDESWGIPGEIRDRLTALANAFGYLC
jgi:Sulfotransferase family